VGLWECPVLVVLPAMRLMGHKERHSNIFTIITILWIGMMGFFLFSPIAFASCPTSNCPLVSSNSAISACALICVESEIKATAVACPSVTLGTSFNNLESAVTDQIAAGQVISHKHITALHNGVRNLLGLADGATIPQSVALLPAREGNETIAAATLPSGISLGSGTTFYSSSVTDPTAGTVISAGAINKIIEDANNIKCGNGSCTGSPPPNTIFCANPAPTGNTSYIWDTSPSSGGAPILCPNGQPCNINTCNTTTACQIKCSGTLVPECVCTTAPSCGQSTCGYDGCGEPCGTDGGNCPTGSCSSILGPGAPGICCPTGEIWNGAACVPTGINYCSTPGTVDTTYNGTACPAGEYVPGGTCSTGTSCVGTTCSATLNCGTDSCGNLCGTCLSPATCSSNTSGTPGACGCPAGQVYVSGECQTLVWTEISSSPAICTVGNTNCPSPVPISNETQSCNTEGLSCNSCVKYAGVPYQYSWTCTPGVIICTPRTTCIGNGFSCGVNSNGCGGACTCPGRLACDPSSKLCVNTYEGNYCQPQQNVCSDGCCSGSCSEYGACESSS